jgi:hypothetical protein
MRNAAWIALALLLTACSEPAKIAEKKEEKPLEPITGRQAFQQVYPASRAWAPDAQPMQVTSIRLDEVKAEPGKSGAWQVQFVSASRGRAKSWTWSAVESSGNLHKGVFAGQEAGWSGPRGQARPWAIQALHIDTPDAYETAVKHADTFFRRVKDPPPVNFLLESTPRFANLYWRVMWGETAGTADFTVFIDASTGQFLERN